NIGKRGLPLRVVAKQLERFVLEVEQQALRAGCLDGTFSVRFARPVSDLSRNAGRLTADILQALTEMRDEPIHSAHNFLFVEERPCVVTKISAQGAKLLCSGPQSSRRWSDAASELAGLVAERVSEKARILKNQPQPTILLLDEQYPFAE